MDIHEVYVAISKELKQLESAEDETARTDCLRAIQDAMDQYKSYQTASDLKSLRNFFNKDGTQTKSLPELDDITSEGIEISLQKDSPMKLFFDITSTVMLAGGVLLEEGLVFELDTD